MATPMLTLSGDAPPEEAARAMLEAGIRSVVVVSEGCRPAGIFTSTDALEALADGDDADDTVAAYMTEPVETVGPGETLSGAAERMQRGGFSHLPVTDGDGDGVGILTKTDLAEAAFDPATVEPTSTAE